MRQLGSTRTSYQRDHALLTPDSFVRAPLPGMRGATAIVHAAPAIGAAFTGYTAEFEPGGALGPASGERFLYVIEGSVAVDIGGRRSELAEGGYAFVPWGRDHHVTAAAAARAVVIEKEYKPLADFDMPPVVIGRESDAPPQPLMGDPGLVVRSLLPADPAFDLAVNTMTFEPGASLPMVECHVMEHGLVMLAGGGIYRLGDNWYPVAAGDFIWMAPYCPQWFGALGKSPARYLIYKDWNR